MTLERFCSILGIAMFGTAKKIQGRPADLLELYRGVTNDDDCIANLALNTGSFKSGFFVIGSVAR
jgi:hypothetical protein